MPQVIADPTKVTDAVERAFTMSDEVVCLQRADGTHWAGEISFGVDSASTDAFVLVDTEEWSQIAVPSDMFCGIWTAIAANTLDFCAIDTDGQPHCWGRGWCGRRVRA
jgi:hypothetical protein